MGKGHKDKWGGGGGHDKRGKGRNAPKESVEEREARLRAEEADEEDEEMEEGEEGAASGRGQSRMVGMLPPNSSDEEEAPAGRQRMVGMLPPNSSDEDEDPMPTREAPSRKKE